jgi:hypothetical protein
VLFLGRHNQELNQGAISDNADRFEYDQKKFEEPQSLTQFRDRSVHLDCLTKHSGDDRIASE